MDLQLQNRTALVTGSSSGIGRATAIAFGREGARVAVTYQKHREGAEQSAANVRETGGEALVVHYDLGDDRQGLEPAASHGSLDRGEACSWA